MATVTQTQTKIEEEEYTEEIKEQRRRDAELQLEQERRDQPFASGSHSVPIDSTRRAASGLTDSEDENKTKWRGKRREEVHQRQPDSDRGSDDDSSSLASIRSGQMLGKTEEEQRDVIAHAGRKITNLMIQEVAKRGEVPEEIIREGFIEGARQTVHRHGQGPHIPSIYGRRSTQPADPNAWRNYQQPPPGGNPPHGGPQGGNPPQRGPPNPPQGGPPNPPQGGPPNPPQGGPPGGNPPGGGPPGGGAPPQNIGPPAYFQRGTWSTGRQEFRRSFHPGTAPGGNDLKLAKPPMYEGTGKPEEAEIWVQQVERHFILQPHLYGTDERGIAWATSYLSGNAAMWYQPYWSTVGRTNHPVTQRWAMFVHAFLQHFGDPDAELKAENKIRDLKQHTSVRRYVDEFNILQTKIQWDELALTSQFKAGLKAQVIRFGGTFGWPIGLEAVKQTALRIDENLMMASFQERKQNPNQPARTPKPWQQKSTGAVAEPVAQVPTNAGETNSTFHLP